MEAVNGAEDLRHRAVASRSHLVDGGGAWATLRARQDHVHRRDTYAGIPEATRTATSRRSTKTASPSGSRWRSTSIWRRSTAPAGSIRPGFKTRHALGSGASGV